MDSLERAGIDERNEREQHAGDDRAGPENIPKIGALQRLALRLHRRGGALRRRGVDVDPAVYTVAQLQNALAALKGGRG